VRHSRRPRSLFHRIYLHGVVLLVLVVVALAVAGLFLGRGPHWRLDPDRLAEHVGGLVAAAPAASLPAEVARLAGELGVDLAVFDDDGHRLAAGGSGSIDPIAPDQVASLRLGRRPPRQGPLLASRPAGSGRYVRVSLRGSERDFLPHAVGALVVVVLVLVVASAPLARAIARPLEQLSRTARRLGEGDLTARAGLARGDEIGELGRTFDEMAERLGRLLEGQRDLLANVSHELRTPMARIRVALDLAREAEPGQAGRHLDAIDEDLAELEKLVADLLTTSRLDAGGSLVLRREAVDPRALVEDALARFRRHQPGREVRARLEGVPSILAEPGLVARVMDNLLDNAARYSDPGAPVDVALSPAPGEVRLTVEDHGIGIAPEDQPRVFTPFFRTDRSRARHRGGVGLGLALAKRIVLAHGGRIALASRPGEGTTVEVVLPAAPRLPS
jgi:signal transduction histidine kinase